MQANRMPGRFALLPLLLLLTPGLPASAADPTGDERSVKTVTQVDLERYAGLWHEVAKIPNKFQKKCAYGTTAEYTLREDGKITVVNRCYESNGDLSTAEGVAENTGAASNAKLRVSFVSFLGWRPFWGDYWVIGLEPDYRWAVIGTPDRKYGWVLARTPALDEASLRRVRAILEQNGYSWDSFVVSAPDATG